MRIANVGSYNLGNVPYTLSKAINMHTFHESRFIEYEPNRFYNWNDVFLKDEDSKQEIQKILDDAELIVFNELYSYEHTLEKGFRIPNDVPFVYYAHGTYTRNNALKIREWVKKHPHTKVILSTPDLSNYVKGKWLMQPLDLLDDRYFFVQKHYVPEDLYISHSPSGVTAEISNDIKGTDTFIKAINGTKWKPVLIEDLPNEQALAKRGGCVAHLDQLNIGCYGVSAIEGLALGQVTLVHINPTFYPEWFVKNCPFIKVWNSEERLRNKLLNLEQNYKSLEYVAVQGRRWVERYHSARKIAKEFIEYVEE